VVVGDVTVDQAIAQTAATFGALPARDAKAPRLPGADRLNLAPSSTEPFKLTHSGRPDVGLSLVAWRTDDFYDDLREARVIQMLRAVVETRARDKLREELGATYSPSVQNENSEVFDEFGMLTVAAEVKPDETGRVMQAMEAVAADLIRGGVTEDELNRARQPILSSLAKDRAGNEYWAQQLGGATWDPRRLEKIRTAEAHVNTVTAADIQRAAAAYLRPDRAWRMLVSHSGATNAAAAAPGGRVVMQPGQALPPGAVIRGPGQGAPAGVIMQGPGQTLPPGAVIQQPGQPAPATVVRPGSPG
jgi:zinc protease